MKLRRKSTVLSALSLLGMVAAWWILAPQQLGGSNSYAVITGNSMEPRLQAGDLAVVRRAGAYAPGQVVAFESRLLGATVLHRITGRDNGRFVLQGDNNATEDPDRPSASEVTGKLWFVIPNIGTILEKIRGQNLLTLIAGVVILAMLGFCTPAKRRRQRRRSSPKKELKEVLVMPVARTLASPSSWRSKQITAVVFVALSAMLALGCAVAFRTPASKSSSSPIPFEHSGTFEYSAPVEPGPVYDGTRLETGEPIFLKLADVLTLRFSYELSSVADHSMSGSGRMVITLSDLDGWSKDLVVGPETSFTGSQVELREDLVLGELKTLIDRVERVTGVFSGSYTLSVKPQIELGGDVAQQVVDESFSPVLTFDLNDLRMKPVMAEEGSVFSSSTTGSVPHNETIPNQISFLGRSLSVPVARTITPIALGAAVIALALAALALRAARPKDEVGMIAAKFGHRTVAVEGSPPVSDTTIELGSMEALVQVADLYQCLAFHATDARGHRYFVDHDSVQYTYNISTDETPALEMVDSGDRNRYGSR